MLTVFTNNSYRHFLDDNNVDQTPHELSIKCFFTSAQQSVTTQHWIQHYIHTEYVERISFQQVLKSMFMYKKINILIDESNSHQKKSSLEPTLFCITNIPTLTDASITNVNLQSHYKSYITNDTTLMSIWQRIDSIIRSHNLQ